MPDSRTSIESLLASNGEPRQEAAATAPTGDHSDVDYRAFSYGRIGRRAQMMVAFVKGSGQTEAYPYSMLSRLAAENPERGCRLWFGPVVVTVEGEGLEKLCQYLREHRVLEVNEASHEQRFAAAGEGLVTRIDIATATATLR
ncbi:hypothetical protein KOR34_01090 [Posidoniimonas corsicana]|uniref:Uncharacterized protein n=1 Tax=Posidoniimonas corsicana TaxID=1938618 RepID=A0A5C5VA92_9BACT|nr:hypothetical protein [Posidoniimonas corsicana]TWT35221.1 hypothetical protein KOR34_01090 [Posidoniimonas corsicana]